MNEAKRACTDTDGRTQDDRGSEERASLTAAAPT